MSASVSIPIAGFKDVYDVPRVEKALHDLPTGANEALRTLYEKMLRLVGAGGQIVQGFFHPRDVVDVLEARDRY